MAFHDSVWVSWGVCRISWIRRKSCSASLTRMGQAASTTRSSGSGVMQRILIRTDTREGGKGGEAGRVVSTARSSESCVMLEPACTMFNTFTRAREHIHVPHERRGGSQACADGLQAADCHHSPPL